MFTVESKQTTMYIPTIYLLFLFEGGFSPLKVLLKEGVEQYIFNGADLMWPGIASLSKEDFKVYDVAVIYSKNQVAGEKGEYVPIAVGRILTS